MRRHRVAIGIVVLCGVGSACSETDEPAAEESGCEVTESEVAALGDTTRVGFSGEEFLANAEGSREHELRYQDGTTTGLTVTVQRAGTELRVYTSRPRSADVEVACTDYAELDLAVTFTSADGRFSETLAAKGRATSASLGTWLATLAPASLAGTWTPPSDAAGHLELGGDLVPGARSGTVLWFEETTDEESRTGSGTPVATW